MIYHSKDLQTIRLNSMSFQNPTRLEVKFATKTHPFVKKQKGLKQLKDDFVSETNGEEEQLILFLKKKAKQKRYSWNFDVNKDVPGVDVKSWDITSWSSQIVNPDNYDG